MNYLHFLTFGIFCFAVVVSGAWIKEYVKKDSEDFIRFEYVAEAGLLGSALIIGEMMLLGFFHCYKAPFLWGVVIANCFFAFNSRVKKICRSYLLRKVDVSWPLVIFIGLLGIFVFRNAYFLIDVDDVSTYLFTQKLWVDSGTNLVGDETHYFQIFLPQFDAVPYALGISLFGTDSLFAGCVSAFWRIILFFLVYGYACYRFNRWVGLAAFMMVLFNDHIYYSGVNSWVVVNAVVPSLVFAAAYNFWESRVKDQRGYFVLACIFTVLLIANKYQAVYLALLLGVYGICVQKRPLHAIREIIKERRWAVAVLGALIVSLLWYLKNYIMTGTPVFFRLAGHAGTFGWTVEQERVFTEIFGGLSLATSLKYLSFSFIWPGIMASKYIGAVISLLPLILIFAGLRNKLEKDKLLEWFFWLGLAVLGMLATCVAVHYDPRYYRYLIGVFAFTSILSAHHVLNDFLGLKTKHFFHFLVIAMGLPGYSVMFDSGMRRPTIQENIGVLANKLHIDSAIKKHWPDYDEIVDLLNKNPEKFNSMAWHMPEDIELPAFFLPVKPVLGLWRNSLIRWDSYENEELVLADLHRHGIQWIVMKNTGGGYSFQSSQDAVKKIMDVKRYRTKGFYDYGFPSEFTDLDL